MRSWPEPPSSRSRLTRGSMRKMSRTSRLKLGAFCSTSVPNELPGPTASWVRPTREPVTTIVSPAAMSADSSEKVSEVAPCSVVVMFSTVWP